ncbi:hypothetical protein ACTFIU_007862 [Dictyostelium citrinum]
MNDIKENEVEIERLVKEIELEIKDKSKNKKIESDKINNRLKRIKQILKSYRLDIRELPKIQQKPYQDKSNKFEEKIKELEDTLNWMEINKNDNNQYTSEDDYKVMIMKSKTIQQKDLKTVNQLNNTINSINNMGSTILKDMADQEEQMKRINKDMNKVDNNLKIANKYLNSIERG